MIFKDDFFYSTPNKLGEFLPAEKDKGSILRLIEVASYRSDHHLELVMDDNQGLAAAFLESDKPNP